MASVASQLIEEVTVHLQRDSLEDAREIRVDGTYFPNNVCTLSIISIGGTIFSVCKLLFKQLDVQSVFSPADCIRWFGIIWD